MFKGNIYEKKNRKKIESNIKLMTYFKFLKVI